MVPLLAISVRVVWSVFSEGNPDLGDFDAADLGFSSGDYCAKWL